MRVNDREAILELAVEAATKAGDILRSGLHDPEKDESAKSHRNDPVTKYDHRADEAIGSVLLETLPDIPIVSEEAPGTASADVCRWVVDPLDGTTNFVCGLPHFCVSIALVEPDGTTVACIHDPIRRETFAALRGRGATVNGSPLAVSRRATLDRAAIGVGLSHQPLRRQAVHAVLPTLYPSARCLRVSGSAALDLAYVAAGRLDAAWYASLSEWDVAAGSLLVHEAGGRVTALSGSPLIRPDSEGVLATNGRIHRAMLDVVSGSLPL